MIGMLAIGWNELIKNYMKHKYNILDGVVEKNLQHKDTTSLKWKKDVIDFFHSKKLKSCLEVGTCHGVTAKVLSSLFVNVDTIEFNPNRMAKAKEYCEGIKFATKFVEADAKIIKKSTITVICKLSNLPIISDGFVNILFISSNC